MVNMIVAEVTEEFIDILDMGLYRREPFPSILFI